MAKETVSLSHLCLFGGKEDHIASREVKHFIHLLAKIDQYQTSRGYYDVLRSLVKFKFQLFDGSSTFESGKHMKTSMQLESDRLPSVFLDSKTDGFSFSQNDMEQHRTTWGNRPILGTESLKVLNGDTRSTASEMVSVGFSFCPLQL